MFSTFPQHFIQTRLVESEKHLTLRFTKSELLNYWTAPCLCKMFKLILKYICGIKETTEKRNKKIIKQLTVLSDNFSST